ncbi:MAG: hypothetical protein ACI9PY_000189 [Ascidiaceihabitans sp.]|jgi:hypothetical protein
MRPGVTVLQLDTHFPRVAGDVGSADSYACEIEVLRVTGASVGGIVTDRPDQIDIAPFEAALRAARGDVIVTSCGFLSYWQAHLAALVDRPFIASSLGALDRLDDPDSTAILTYDATRLGAAHLGQNQRFAPCIIGLDKTAHLRAVIGGDARTLDQDKAARETVATVQAQTTNALRTLVLECTNLPPYKSALAAAFDVDIIDILTEIEAVRPKSIRPAFL